MGPELVVPVLAAGPFTLRPFAMSDLGLVGEAAQDPYIPLVTTVPAQPTVDGGRAFIERQWGRARSGQGYSLAIADAATGRAVGQIGLWLRNTGEGRASIGYWVTPSARGRRAASHALAAMVGWAFTGLRIPRLELYIEPWNEVSIRTAERAGFQREGLLREWQEIGGRRTDMLLYALLPADLLVM